MLASQGMLEVEAKRSAPPRKTTLTFKTRPSGLVQIMSIADHLPDAWFDILARFVPGAFTLGVWHYYKDEFPLRVGFEHPSILLAMAYVIGHFLQPVASWIARRAEPIVLEYDDLRRWKWLKPAFDEIKGSSASLSRNVKLAEKAYAEAVSFFAIGVGAILLMGWFHVSPPVHGSLVKLWVVFIVSMTWGVERTCARIRKMHETVRWGK